MKTNFRLSGLIVMALFITLVAPPSHGATVRTSIGLVGGVSQPVGWWSDRWDPGQSGEINLRYEFAPGTGLLIIAGLTKSNLANLSDTEIFQDSNLRDIEPEILPYTNILKATQGGAFKQISTGFGFYTERMIGSFRGYGSIAMIVYNYKFDRSQFLEVELEIPELGGETYRRTDVWFDEKDGSDVGGQLAVGVVRQIKPLILLDVSIVYHLVDINQTNGALAYWGRPVRTWTPEQIDDAKGRVDFLQLRVGFRFGR